MSHDNDEKVELLRELKHAGLLGVALWAIGIVTLFALVILALTREYEGVLPLDLERAGQFGDSFGVITSLFNALAFAAVAVTVVLQNKELRETRKELKKQAQAAVDQVKITLRLERLKIRPLITYAWEKKIDEVRSVQSWQVNLKIRNVGLGPAVIDGFQLLSGQRSLFEVTHDNDPNSAKLQDAVKTLEGINLDGQMKASISRLTGITRIVAPNEALELVRLSFANKSDQKFIHTALTSAVRASVRFHSLDDEELDTYTQLGNVDLSPPVITSFRVEVEE